MSTERKTLTSPKEVMMVAPVDSHFPSQDLKPLISQKEEELFNVLLGWDFYQDLITDLETHIYEEFNESSVYNSGDKILFTDDRIWVANATTSAGENPSNSTKWDRVSKFQGTAHEYLWDNYLQYLLAFFIVNTGAAFAAIKMTGLGLVQEGSTVTDKSLQVYSEATLGLFKTTLMNAHMYMRRNSTSFPNYLGNLCKNRNTPMRRVRNNFGFSMS